MKIILREDFKSLGNAGKVVEVKKGYARNFLIPKGIAYEATPAFLKIFEEEKRQQQFKQRKEVKSAQEMVKKLEGVSVTIPVSVGEGDKMYGSVTSQNIAEHLEKQNIEIYKRKIELEEPIKELGIYQVPIKLHREVTASIKVWVVKE